MDDLFSTLGIIVVVGCVLPLISLLVIGFMAFRFGKNRLDQLADPSVDKMYAQYTAMYQATPTVDTEKLVHRIIHQQAVKCGIVGAVTGFGGFITLPLTLPIDFLLSVRIQASMISFIARTYGQEKSLDNRAATYMVLTGSGEVTQMSQKVLLRYSSSFLSRFLGKSLSKLIPFLGAGISFLVNYAIARSTGHLALQWYKQKSLQNIATQPQQISAQV